MLVTAVDSGGKPKQLLASGQGTGTLSHVMADKFTIRHTLEKGIPVVHLAGEITSEAEDALLDCYRSLPEDQLGHVVLDFLETKYINSSGIAILIQLITRASDKKHKIEFASLSPHFRKVMDIVGLTDFVQIHDSLADALG